MAASQADERHEGEAVPRISSFALGAFMLVAVVTGILAGSVPVSSVTALIRAQVGSAEAASLPTPTSIWSPPPNTGIPATNPVTTPAGTDVAVTSDMARVAAGSCTAVLQFTRYTSTEFQAVILVTNTGESPIAGWMISLELTEGSVLTSTSGVIWTPGGGTLATAHNDATNGPLAVGQTAPIDIRGAGPALPPISLECAAR